MEMREVFGQTLVELGKTDPRVLVLDADLHTSSKAVYFRSAYPQRFLQVGIAEQNLFGIAAGLAIEGYIPFPCTFAAFAARRALDQIAISICYPRLNVKIPGSYAGLPTSRAGASHAMVEDLAIMRALPNLLVADPGDNADLRAIMHAAMRVDGPVYFRVTRFTFPDLFGPEHTFQWGKGEVLRSGHDVSLFGTGMMSGLCLKAADLLAAEGVDAEVIHLASIKPIDRDLIAASVGKTGCAVSAENASIVGGFGAAVAEVLAETCPAPLARVGVRDRFVNSAGTAELFRIHQMLPSDIAQAALTALKRKSRSLVR
jgi:transketolase